MWANPQICNRVTLLGDLIFCFPDRRNIQFLLPHFVFFINYFRHSAVVK